MRLRCIKDKGAHWGPFFKEGDWYNISKVYFKDMDVVTDFDKYMDHIKEFLTAVAPYKSLENDSDKDNLQRLNETYKINPYLKRVSIQFCEVVGLDKQKHIFSTAKKSDIADEYGTYKFDLSVSFLEDTFITKEDYRNDILNNLLK